MAANVIQPTSGVKYQLVKVSATYTRPANTTAYTAGLAISDSTTAPTVLTFDLGAAGAVMGQSIEIRRIDYTEASRPSSLPLVNVYLSPTTFAATADGSALSIPNATHNVGGAWLNLTTQNYTAINCRASLMNANEQMILSTTDTKLYGVIQAASGFTPASAETLTVTLYIALL